MIRVVAVALLLMLASCGGSHKEVVENPYGERMKELTQTGVDAMRRERWQVAASLFERALQAAQLANDPQLIGQAWYNLGVLHISAGEGERGEGELLQAINVARRHGQDVTVVRSRIALALLHQKSGKEAWKPDTLSSSMPLDLHLSVARLAQLQQRFDVARSEYEYVIGRGGKDRETLQYKIDAHMGMALLLTEMHDTAAARDEVAEVLELSREIGAPRQAAHALLLSAKLGGDEAQLHDNLMDALSIYKALDDVRGQRESINALLALSSVQRDAGKSAQLKQRLQKLGGSAAEAAAETAPEGENNIEAEPK